MKYLVFGTGLMAQSVVPVSADFFRSMGYELIGFLDNNPQKQECIFEGKKIYAPKALPRLEYDVILLCCSHKAYMEIREQLIREYGVDETKITSYFSLLKERYFQRYRQTEDEDIRATLQYWKHHDMSVFNQFIEQPSTYHEVFYDKNIDLPYILFETAEGHQKPMYYPKNFPFDVREGHRVLIDVFREQSSTSPHLYTTHAHDVTDGDVLLDAGASAGDFSLYHIERLSGLYLFENDARWSKPLFFTFRPYEEKVTIYQKAVSGRTSANEISIDDALEGEKVDFLKMDVEGAEIDGLMGSEQLLRGYPVKCSICSYHHYGDEEKIKGIFHDYGYSTSTSKGYMSFFFSADTWEHADFRRGVVYGDR